MLISGDSQGNKGRSLEAKSAVRVCVGEVRKGKTGNVNFSDLENFEATTLKYTIKEMVE